MRSAKWGEVVGFSNFSAADGGDYHPHAFLWTADDGIRDLGTLPAPFDDNSDAWGINRWGQVVGRSCDADGNCHAFLWQDGAMRDLNVPHAPRGRPTRSLPHQRLRPDHRPSVRRRGGRVRRLPGDTGPRVSAAGRVHTSREAIGEPEWTTTPVLSPASADLVREPGVVVVVELIQAGPERGSPAND